MTPDVDDKGSRPQKEVVARSNDMQMVMVFLFLGAIEFCAVHLALRAAPPIFRFAHAAIALPFLAFLFAGLLSLKLNPVCVLEHGLRIPTGLFGHVFVRFEFMKAAARSHAKALDGATKKAFMVMSEPNFVIHIKIPGREVMPRVGPPVLGFALSIDQPDDLARYLQTRIRHDEESRLTA